MSASKCQLLPPRNPNRQKRLVRIACTCEMVATFNMGLSAMHFLLTSFRQARQLFILRSFLSLLCHVASKLTLLLSIKLPPFQGIQSLGALLPIWNTENHHFAPTQKGFCSLSDPEVFGTWRTVASKITQIALPSVPYQESSGRHHFCSWPLDVPFWFHGFFPWVSPKHFAWLMHIKRHLLILKKGVLKSRHWYFLALHTLLVAVAAITSSTMFCSMFLSPDCGQLLPLQS